MVGEIQDEFDHEEKLIRKIGRQIWRVSGLAPLHDVEEELNIPDFDDDEVSTFGGLVTTEFGRIPKQEQVIEFRNLRVRIIEADDKLVQLAEVQKLEKPADENLEQA